MADEITGTEIKGWLKSKTFWMGVLTIFAGIVEYIGGVPVGASMATISVGIINIIIRFFTNTAISGTPGAKPK